MGTGWTEGMYPRRESNLFYKTLFLLYFLDNTLLLPHEFPHFGLWNTWDCSPARTRER